MAGLLIDKDALLKVVLRRVDEWDTNLPGSFMFDVAALETEYRTTVRGVNPSGRMVKLGDLEAGELKWLQEREEAGLDHG